jgi:hypothetical protein
LRNGNIVEPVSIEKPARAVDDSRAKLLAMTGRIGHGGLDL